MHLTEYFNPKMCQITRCNNLQKDMLTKDMNFCVFSDTSGRVSETYQVDWSRIYSIFDNDDLSEIQSDQLAYLRIRDSGIHSIAARPAILPYNDVVKWIIEHTNMKYHSFNRNAGLNLANFHPEVFIKAYALKLARQLLNADFVKASKSRYNFDEMLKSWMSNLNKFS